MPRKGKPALPTQGDAFAVKLRPGLWTACRVLRLPNGNERRGWIGTGSILVAGSGWTGSKRPTIEMPELRPILQLTHHEKNEPCAVWLDERPPKKFVLIGSIQPTKADLKVKSSSSAQWNYLTGQALLQWQWESDRDSVLAATAEEERKEIESAVEKQRAKRKQWKGRELEDLKGYRFLSSWTKSPVPAPEVRADCRRILRDAAKALVALGPKPTRNKKKAVLRECIESFNQLDREHPFIETLERDDILEEFKMLAHACGLGKEEDMADEWREW